MMGREVYMLEYIDWQMPQGRCQRDVCGIFETRELARIALQDVRATIMDSIDFRSEQVEKDCEDFFMTRVMRNGNETRRTTIVITPKKLNKLW